MNKNALDILQHTSIRNIEYILQNLDLNYVTSGIRKAVKRSLELVIKQTTDIEEKNEVILLQYEFSKTTYKQGYINKKTKEEEFIPEFEDIITNLQVTQYQIRRTTSQIEIFGILSENDFWVKLEDLWKNNVDKLPPYTFAKSIILYLGGCEIPQSYPEEHTCDGLKISGNRVSSRVKSSFVRTLSG